MNSTGHNSAASNHLRSFVDRLVRLEEQKRAIVDDIKVVKAEAKGGGFDVRALGVAVRRAMESASEAVARREHEAVTELYLATLGMLDGTPLGDNARKRLMEPPTDADRKDDGKPSPVGQESPPDDGDPPRGLMTDEEIETARRAGREAARGGKKVIENPHVAGDPRRAAWDEGWCSAAGSDGMDIPEAWRRKKPKKVTPDKRAGEGGAE